MTLKCQLPSIHTKQRITKDTISRTSLKDKNPNSERLKKAFIMLMRFKNRLKG